MNIKEVHRVAGRIKASLFKNSNSHSIGMLKSHFRGSGLQFKEHQVYGHGDDVRFIDWKLLAKTGTPYIKTFEEERNVEIVTFLDASLSMFSGYKRISKLQAGVEICCLLFLLSKQTKDRIHVVVMSDDIIDIPPGQGEAGIVELIYQLQRWGVFTDDGLLNLSFRHKKKISQKEKTALLGHYLNRRKEIIILSDLNEFIDLSILYKMTSRSNVHCFQILSPLDEAKKIPYAIHSRDFDRSDGILKKIHFKEEDQKQHSGKRIKKIRVQNRYLEEFVKEML